MKIEDLKNKLVAILGYGVEGKAVASYLLKHGIKPVLFDQKPWAEWTVDDQNTIKMLGVNFIFGPDAFKELAGFDVAFRSPGIKLSVISSQLSVKATVTSQTKWFFEHCPCKIIGVTGTKGKGTTSALIYEMLKADSKNAYLTGNIGKVQPLEILDELKPDDWVVYELSSFQLQDLTQSPHIGVVLMTTQEHLDYHADEKEYVDAKAAVVKYQTTDDFALINADFENSIKIGTLGNGEKFYFSRKSNVMDFDGRQNPSYALNSINAFMSQGRITVKNSNLQIPISKFQLNGEHNLENIMAAILAARCAGCKDEAIESAAQNFKGLEHRLEFVAEKNGIKFYNDSFSTTPETAIAAVNSFSEPLIVILGGSSKNSNFLELGKTINQSKNIKALILIGEQAHKIKSAIKFSGTILQNAKTMLEIFNQIKSVAQKGDIVLLSPACASFDMFKSYSDRGEQFKKEVLKY